MKKLNINASGLLMISLLLSLQSCQTSSKTENSLTEQENNNPSVTDYPEEKRTEPSKSCSELLKEFLKKNPISDVASVEEDSDGNIIYNGTEGFVLSYYRFDYLNKYQGDLDGDGVEDILLVIANEGGGGGGNVSVKENYSCINGEIQPIQDVKNIPELDYGYNYVIEGIENGKVLLKVSYFNEGSTKFDPPSKIKNFSARLEGESLIIE